MCLYPRLLKNPKYTANQKNGGVIPPVTDERVLYVPIGCQNCIECRKQKARAWQVRLLEDIKTNRNGKFVTFTFSDEAWTRYAMELDEAGMMDGYELENEIATRAMRLFLERWRRRFKKSLRHWCVTELGHQGTENIHLHGIIWTDESLDTVDEIWNGGKDGDNGFVWKGKETNKGTLENYVSERTVNYIVKYVNKVDFDHQGYKSRILTSPGIGRNYMDNWDSKGNKFKGSKTNECYRTRTGHKISMPIYWRNKIYSDQEREQLWIMKLDKEERFILGEKVSVKDGEEEYVRGLETAREVNRRLGYGSDFVSEERLDYEKARRKLMQATRRRRGESKLLAAGQFSTGLGLNY